MDLTGYSVLGAFVTPGLFIGGLAAAGAPILIHLLARRRFKRLRWAAIDFLLQAERKNKRRLRLEEWILLALRCLAVILIGAALARPFLAPDSLLGGLRGAGRAERIIILDDSMSMAYRVDGEPVFDRAKQAVRRLVEGFRNESPDDTVSLFKTSALDTPIESGTFLNDAQTEALFARVEALAPSQASLDRGRVVADVADFLADSPNIINAAIYVISDFQRSTWIERDADVKPEAEGATPLEPWREWAGDDRSLFVTFVNVGEREARNTAVTALELGTGPLVAATPSAARVRIANHSQLTLESLSVDVFVSGVKQQTVVLETLEAGDEVTTDVELEFLRSGSESARVEIPEDALAPDNTRYLSADVSESIRVLVVDGEPAPDRYDDEVTFLMTALRPEGALASGLAPVVMDETEWEDANLHEFHLVILANVHRISEPMVERLERFVREGGGLLIFAGDQTNGDLYNVALHREGEGLLPVTLTEVQRPAEAVHLVVTDRLHPVLRALAGDGDPLGVGNIRFRAFWGVHEPDGTENAPEAGALPDAARSPSAPIRVIVRFDDGAQSPAIIERRFGAGRVVFVATAADKEWNDWPDHPTYLPIVMELARYVARGTDGRSGLQVGDVIQLPIDPSVFESDVTVRTPAWPDEREIVITPIAPQDGSDLVVRWDHTPDPGLYRFVFARRDGGETVRAVAVNVDPRESDLTMATEDELSGTAGDVPFRYIEGLAMLFAGGDGERRTELWRFFLIVALVALLSEHSLAWAWGRRRDVPVMDVRPR